METSFCWTQMDCFFDTHMAVYFVDWVVPNSEDDILGIDSTLFGDILCIPRVGTFLLDVVVGDVRPTPQLLAGDS
jgi:hypothetical protein